MNIITSIQAEIVNPSVPVTSVLRKAQILAYQLGNQEFTDWVEHELNGYPAKEGLPSYRVTEASLTYIGNNGFNIYKAPFIVNKPTSEVRLLYITDGVPVIEKLLEGEGDRIRQKLPSRIIENLNKTLAQDGCFCIEASKEASKIFAIGILEIVRNRLLKFVLELRKIYPDIEDTLETNHLVVYPSQISYLVHNHILVENGGSMSTFDQRNQVVFGNQYNAGNNITFEDVNDFGKFTEALEGLLAQFSQAIGNTQVSEDKILDAEYNLKKAIQESKKPIPKKSAVKSYLNKTKEVLKDVVGMAGILVTLSEAIQVLDKLF